MLSTSLWATLLASSPLSVAAYSVIDTYDSTNWLQKFDFFNGTDPTHGFVNYLTQGETGFDDLFSTDGGQVSMKVDSSTNNLPTNGPGRASVRVTSQASYGINTLIVLDAAHMPIGCGTWPAFWTVGNQTLQKWPKGGEIDIIEGVNNVCLTRACLEESCSRYTATRKRHDSAHQPELLDANDQRQPLVELGN